MEPSISPEEEEDINHLYGPLLSHEDLGSTTPTTIAAPTPTPTSSEMAAHAASSFRGHVYSSRDTVVTRVYSVDNNNNNNNADDDDDDHPTDKDIAVVLKEHTSYEKLEAYREAAIQARVHFGSWPSGFDLPLVPRQVDIFDERSGATHAPARRDRVPVAEGMEGALLVEYVQNLDGADAENHTHNPREAYSRHRPPAHDQVSLLGDTQVLLHPKIWLGMRRPRQPNRAAASVSAYFEEPLYLDEVLSRLGEDVTRRLARQMGAALAVIHYDMILDAAVVRFRLARERRDPSPTLWACGLDEMRRREPAGEGHRAGVEDFLAERVWANEPCFPRPDVQPSWVFDAFRNRYVEVGEHILGRMELFEERGEVSRPDLQLLAFMLGSPVIGTD